MANGQVDTKPKDGLAGLDAHWKTDMLSGFIVFLIALPLSLGIAMASGVPPIAGVFSAIVGGVVVGMTSGSFVTINGPAAGLIVVVLSGIERLGGYEQFLAATVVAGALLVVFGLVKAGKLGDFFPLTAVHGMLAAIGIIILSKQAHVALGVIPEAKSPVGLLIEIPHSILNMNAEIAVVGLTSLAILIAHKYINNKYIQKIPAPLLVVIVGIALGKILGLSSEHMVQLPDQVTDAITFPDFSNALTYDFVSVVMTIALIQSLESLLSAAAVDQLDQYKRKSNLNRDIAAVGIGSMVAAMIGGIPIIAEIVRSSANVNNGAKTRWSNVFHGLFLLLFIILIPGLLKQIPLACLGAILVFIGFRLASPHEFVHVYKIGRAQLVIFLVTIVSVLATDLLMGIGMGILTKVFVAIYYKAPIKYFFNPRISVKKKGNSIFIEAEGALVFTNYILLKERLMKLPTGKSIIMDVSKVNYIDHTSKDHLIQFKKDYKEQGEGGEFRFSGLEMMRPVSHHHLSARVRTADEFVSEKPLNRHQKELAAFAEENDYSFYYGRQIPKGNFSKFFSLRGKYIDYETNYIDGPCGIGDVHLEACDIGFKESRMILTVKKMSAMYIYDLPGAVPFFTLEDEHPIDIIRDFGAGFKDIDFGDFPDFSRKFLLIGKDEKKITEFFTPASRKYLETFNVGYTIEGHGHSLLVHRGTDLLTADEIQKLFEFSKGLVDALLKK